MDFQRIAKSSPNRHLPMELCREILSRLPVKSLLRFCCVSKPWLFLIKDPDFHSLHLQNFKNNRDETHLLVVKGMSMLRDCVVRCSDTFENNSGILLTLDRKWRIVCSTDGLVLLKSWGNHLRIWNPSIRKFHDIPTLPEIETSQDIRNLDSEIGLGYDPFVKDYKCVTTVHVNRNQPPLVAVYTLGADLWKIIPFQVKEGSNFDWDFRPTGKAVYVQGSLYFLVYHTGTELWELGSFDMSSEVFRTISLPEADWLKATITLVRNGCSSLALFYYYDSLTMWVFESKSMCWTEAYESGLVVPEYLYLNKNRDIFMWWREQVDLSLATDNSLALDFSLVSSCNLETKVEKVLLIEKEGYNYSIPEVYGYIESLILLK